MKAKTYRYGNDDDYTTIRAGRTGWIVERFSRWQGSRCGQVLHAPYEVVPGPFDDERMAMRVNEHRHKSEHGTPRYAMLIIHILRIWDKDKHLSPDCRRVTQRRAGVVVR